MSKTLSNFHLRILKYVAQGSKITPARLCVGYDGFQIGRGRVVYSSHFLDDLRRAGMLTDKNLLTAQGELWLAINS